MNNNFFRMAAILFAGLAFCTNGTLAQDNEPDVVEIDNVFSGPQPGEPLPAFTMTKIPSEDNEATEVVTESKNGPMLIIFFNKRTRPAFGLTRAVTKYAASKAAADKGGLKSVVCFLAKDPTETRDWVQRIQRLLTEDIEYGVYADGEEGPGAYGLNRHVQLTVLVADKGKVTYNAALTQPDLAIDGNKILQAINDVTGGGEAPDIVKLSGQDRMMRSRPQADSSNNEPNMRRWLAPVIQQGATKEEVDRAAKALEAHCANDEAARKAVGRIANTVVNSGRLENYGTIVAQDYLKKWAVQYGSNDSKGRQSSDGDKASDEGNR